ncbi:cell morphogenesis N-terminal-domain-containing protein [Pilobolus umbonatus]|nr:cell morphogenesis N-terminal-domain-containing protein [Pilobolus umbonatus]
MYPRALKMTLKPRHISAGYPLITTLLCVSRKDFFTANWMAVVESCYQKFNKVKEPLLSYFLFRCTESTSITYKKLDAVIKTLFPPFRRAVYPSDTSLDHFILITYFALMRDVELGTKKVLFYLLNTEAGPTTSTSHNLDLINPERMIIGLSAFRLALADLEKNISRPPFPVDSDMANCSLSISGSADVFSGPIRAVKSDVMEKVEEIISKTLISLDQTVGRLLVLDEKNIILRPMNGSSMTNSVSANSHYHYNPINPSSFDTTGPQIHHSYMHFSVSYTKDKQPYFDVIKTIVDSMPRLMPAGMPLPKLVEIVTRYTVHTDPEVIKSASKALLRIAAQIDSQTVVAGYARFISKIEDKFSDVIQSLSHAEDGGVMKLYVGLLTSWLDHLDLGHLELRGSMDLSKPLDLVQETESNGLLFMCSHSAGIRHYAMEILKTSSHLTDLLQRVTPTISRPLHSLLVSIDKDISATDTLFGQVLTPEMKNRILYHQRRGVEVVFQIAKSEYPADTILWNQLLFPEMVKRSFALYPNIVAHCRLNICSRLVQIQPSIQAWLETPGATGTLSMTKNQKAASSETIEQWRLYLIFACATAVPIEHEDHKGIWSGRPKGTIERIPRDLFRFILPYLSCEHRQIRESAIEGLGHTHPQVYSCLIAELEPYIKTVLDDGKQRNNQKPYQNKRSKKHDRLRISLMHVLERTSYCLPVNKDMMHVIMSYIKETKSFLKDSEVQLEWEYQRLRIYLCGLVEHLYESILQLDDPTLIMSFETRSSLFKMFEEWCGYGVAAELAQQRHVTMMQDVIEQCKDMRDKSSMKQLMEEERKALESACLSAMAMLCRGPLYAYLGQKKGKQGLIQFDTLNILKWIDAIFESRDPKYYAIARQALEAVMLYHQDQAALLDDIIEQCYAGNPKLEFTQGYFQALAHIVTQVEDYPYHIHQIMCLALFKSGDAKKSIRKTAIELLRVVEDRVFSESCAKEYEIGITNSLPAIYKHTQTLLSARLALDHPEQTYSVLSEITQRFEHISPNSQRSVLMHLLPWYRKVDLGSQDDLSASAFMVLSNLFYITIKFGDMYVKETSALWSQLVDHGRNVRAILVYLLDMGQEKRNPWFVIYAQRVFVYLSRTHAFPTVIEETIAEISPRSMVPHTKQTSMRHANAFPLLFVADMELPSYPKKPLFSRGQLAMIYLVDLATEAGADLAPHLPLLVHTLFVQLDHFTSIVCDQARCFLINLIHSIVVRQQAVGSEASQKASETIQWLMAKEGKRLWAYENITPENRHVASELELRDLVGRVVELFTYEDIGWRQRWGETALKWATCCSVRHIACRSFQCFRALMPSFNQHMLADMLARLSKTIADTSEEIRGFALEIILTLTQVAKAMDRAHMEQFPQLFWTAVACLYSPYESEHCEGLVLLDIIFTKLEFNPKLAESFPKEWSSEFDGLQPLLLKGLQFSSVEEKTFELLRLVCMQDHYLPLVDPTETRLMYLILASIPRLLHGLDDEKGIDPAAVQLAGSLVDLMEVYGLPTVQRILATYPIQKNKFQEEFLKQILSSMRDVFLVEYCQQAFMFSLLLVKNKIPYYREKGLLLVENLVPYVTGKMFPADIVIDIAALNPLLELVSTPYCERALAIFNSEIHTVMNEEPVSELIWGTNNFMTSAEMTRRNIHAVVYECSSILPIEHNIQFSLEDYSVDEGRYPGHESDDLMNALKDLDDFFNEDGEPISPSTSNQLKHGSHME